MTAPQPGTARPCRNCETPCTPGKGGAADGLCPRCYKQQSRGRPLLPKSLAIVSGVVKRQRCVLLRPEVAEQTRDAGVWARFKVSSESALIALAVERLLASMEAP